uniref:Uncharacterized protein n=1 Tax=Anopheles atroparvus TaxID=41427 RepID=A0A182ITB5_ANOAO
MTRRGGGLPWQHNIKIINSLLRPGLQMQMCTCGRRIKVNSRYRYYLPSIAPLGGMAKPSPPFVKRGALRARPRHDSTHEPVVNRSPSATGMPLDRYAVQMLLLVLLLPLCTMAINLFASVSAVSSLHSLQISIESGSLSIDQSCQPPGPGSVRPDANCGNM